jgi:hypothetical protein
LCEDGAYLQGAQFTQALHTPQSCKYGACCAAKHSSVTSMSGAFGMHSFFALHTLVFSELSGMLFDARIVITAQFL